MTTIIVFSIIMAILFPLSYFWVRGIDYMNKNHPDYKGDDLFDEEDRDNVL
jgi:hypothetical protein